MKTLDLPKLIGANGVTTGLLVVIYNSDATDDIKIVAYLGVFAIMALLQVAALYAPSPKDK